MNVNPTIELYLLDVEGRIRAFSAPPDTIVLKSVDMAPLRAYFRDPDRLPVLGDDPRSPTERRVFSVAPVGSTESMDGYLYAVIGGQRYQGLVGRFRESHTLRVSLAATLATLLAGAAWAWASFALLTRRVRRLSSSLEQFRQDGFRTVPARLLPPEPPSPRDELDSLSRDLRTLMDLTVAQVSQLREGDERLREMIGSMSHDLRTPLASLGCCLETLQLKDQSLTPELRASHLQIAARHQARLNLLVNSLFELAHLELPDARCDLQPTAVEDLLMDLAQKFAPRAAKLEISIETILPDELPRVRADVGLLERALDNLVDNALRHTPAGGSIRLHAALIEARVRVTVEDNGIGISPEHQTRVFERFYRVDRSRRDPGAGAGLGLAITRRIVELHGGDIQVHSRSGAGSAFALTLPLADRPQPPAAVPSGHAARRGA